MSRIWACGIFATPIYAVLECASGPILMLLLGPQKLKAGPDYTTRLFKRPGSAIHSRRKCSDHDPSLQSPADGSLFLLTKVWDLKPLSS